MKITPVLSQGYSCNSYVIRGEKTCVIDPGFGKINYGIKPEDADIILLTHNHFDHSGNTHLFENATVYVHEKDLPFLLTGKGIYSEAYGEKYSPVDIEKLPAEINLGNSFLKTIHTPGHTPGSCCFYDEKGKNLFSGDTVFADGIGRTDLLGGNSRELVKSLELVSSIDFKHLFPGHGMLGNKESAIDGLEFIRTLDNC